MVNSDEYYYEFGRYLIYVPDWEKGYLRLKYPSQYPIKDFPKVAVSSEFISLVQEMIDHQVFNEDAYLRLSNADKELFDRLIRFANITKNTVKDLSRHRRLTDVKRDADIHRFELLKGEIIAGNDNPDVIDEFKRILTKLHDQRLISKPDFDNVLQHISA